MDITAQNILVTGADGFIGSHLCEYLISRNCRVRALSYYNSFNNWGWLETLERSGNLEIVSGDIRDEQICREITADIDVIFHLAALIAIPYSYRAPRSYLDTNVTGTLNMCAAALENNCKRFIHTSTSEVYGTARYAPIDESHPLQPQSPYSASKIGADCVALSQYFSFQLPLILARPFNTYGPRQSARAVIPTIIIQLLNGSKEIELGDTRPTRDFNYVLDTCRAMVSLAEKESAIGEVVNIGSNTETSIETLFKTISEILGIKAVIKPVDQRKRPEKSEVFRLCCDNGKIREIIDYKPAYDLVAGLKETISWFSKSENIGRYKSEIYNI